ncbi:MAG: hypothetical protein WC479_07345 [Candidatus Izemoplasmatales bacterium]|jgi:hypothetical protein
MSKADKCFYCKKRLDTDEPITVLNNGKMAHDHCARDYWARDASKSISTILPAGKVMGNLAVRYCPYDNQECKEKGCEGCNRRISRIDLLKLPVEQRNQILSRMIEQSGQGVANSCEAMGMD